MQPSHPPAGLDAAPPLDPSASATRALPAGDVVRASVFALLAVGLALHGTPIPAVVAALAAALFVIEALVHRRRDDLQGAAGGRAFRRALAGRRRVRH